MMIIVIMVMVVMVVVIMVIMVVVVGWRLANISRCLGILLVGEAQVHVWLCSSGAYSVALQLSSFL